MLATRIIPCLDVDEGSVFKGIRFKNLIAAGNPVTLAQRYYEEGADELTFLDIGASWKSRKTLIEVDGKSLQSYSLFHFVLEAGSKVFPTLKNS